MKDFNYKELISQLDDLCKRLQDEYNNGITFEQHEEDRLVVYDAIEILEKFVELVERKNKHE